jgi:short-subunit dehydrogenase
MGKVLITGGSKGIGKAMAEEFLKRKYDIILVSRNKQDLENTREELQKKYKGSVIKTETADLTKEENWNILINKYNEVDILVNNAGMVKLEYSYKIERDTLLDGIRLNVEAPCFLGNYYIKKILERENTDKMRGIINVSSIAGIFPHPLTTFYSPSKYFLDQYSCNMRYELRKNFKKRKINVMSLCPGAVDTEFTGKGKFSKLKKFCKKLFFLNLMMSPEYVAESAVKDFFKGKKRSIPGFFYKTAALAVKIFPERLSAELMYKGMVKEVE